MNSTVASVLTVCAFVLSAQAADVNVKIEKVHLCCKACVTGVEKAIGKVEGATATVDKDAGTVSLSGQDTATVQKAADALVAAGFFGKTSDSSIKIKGHTGAKGKKVETLEVKDVHLCCNGCVKGVDEALKTVTGVKKHTATKGAKSFEVTGEFNDKDVFGALHKAGYAGKAAQ